MPERAGGRSERADASDAGFDGLADGLLVLDIADDQLDAVEVGGHLRRRYELGDTIAEAQSLADNMTPGWPVAPRTRIFGAATKCTSGLEVVMA